MFNEFKAFLTKSNALALAIGVIIGAATGKVVTALVSDLLMPVIGLLLPGGEWREASITLSRMTDTSGKIVVNALKYGDFIGTVVDFTLISFVVFLITKALIKPDPGAPTKKCPFCCETVPEEATRCKSCTSHFSET